MDTVVNWFVDLDEESQAVHNAKNRNKNAKENPKLHNKRKPPSGKTSICYKWKRLKLKEGKRICHEREHLPVFL